MHSVNKTVKYKIELSPSRRKTQSKGNESCKITFPVFRPFLPEFLSIYSFTTRPFSLKNSRKKKRERNHASLFTSMNGMACLKKASRVFSSLFVQVRRGCNFVNQLVRRSIKSPWDGKKNAAAVTFSFSLNRTFRLPAA